MSENDPAICDLCYYVRGKTPHARDCPRRPENAPKVEEARAALSQTVSSPVSSPDDDPRIRAVAEIVTSYRDTVVAFDEREDYLRGARRWTLALVADVLRAIALVR